MANKQVVNKAQFVRDYLKAHPAATCKEIVAALEKQGIKITFGYVATVKAEIDAAAKTEVVQPAALPGKPPDPLTMDQLKTVAQAIRILRLHQRIENPHRQSN
jgi:hypothetical protein